MVTYSTQTSTQGIARLEILDTNTQAGSEASASQANCFANEVGSLSDCVSTSISRNAEPMNQQPNIITGLQPSSSAHIQGRR